MRKGYVADFVKAVLRGIWDGFGITDTLVIVIIVLFYFSSQLGLHVFEDHPPAWLVTLIAGIFVAVEALRATYRLYVTERKRREAYEDPLLIGYPNVRVADNPQVLDLFQSRGPERDKLLSFLTNGFISCWARRSTGTSNDLVPVPGKVWNDGWFFDLETKRQDNEGVINQTLIRENDANRYPKFNDLYLNFTQMRNVWPTIELTQAKDEIR